MDPPQSPSSDKQLASLVFPEISTCQLREAYNNLRYYDERLNKLYARVIDTGNGLFVQADDGKADKLVFWPNSLSLLEDDSYKRAKEQERAATAHARRNIQCSLKILHDLYGAVRNDQQSLRDFEYQYGGGYPAPLALQKLAILNQPGEDRAREVKDLLQRWSAREFEIESEKLLKEAEGRFRAAEDYLALADRRRLSDTIDRGPEIVNESAERETLVATTPVMRKWRYSW